MVLTLKHNLVRLLGLALAPPTETSTRADDRWAGRKLTVVAVDGTAMTVRDRDALVTLPLSYGLEQALANAMRETGRTDPAGLVLLREPFEVDGLPFWQWAVLPQPLDL